MQRINPAKPISKQEFQGIIASQLTAIAYLLKDLLSIRLQIPPNPP